MGLLFSFIVRCCFTYPPMTYTVLMLDANYAGSLDPNADLSRYWVNLHWPQNDATLASDGTTTNSTAAVIPYAGPAPPSGIGPHRYTVLLYAQPANFTALRRMLLAGSYFTVEVGTATVNVSPTTAVNYATFLAISTASRSGSGTVSGGASSSPIQESSADLGKGVSVGSVL
ncbi:hypothetical protein BS47DRAFT_1357811 [Hydnum rufescens UP504]|uniref:PEBP-like protein n=1 Tax=Hydnum rufescens UP504 TaxID=1448309 RepID=A0A9P6E1Y5_9AGAM|nr:hypothetical protein BS47DRAFT_1357811 [Hydnum rufescens UP504]